MSLQLSAKSKALILARDRRCVVCAARGLFTVPILTYQIRPGDSPANGVRLCSPCKAAIDRREVGIAGQAPDSLSITDGRSPSPSRSLPCSASGSSSTCSSPSR